MARNHLKKNFLMIMNGKVRAIADEGFHSMLPMTGADNVFYAVK